MRSFQDIYDIAADRKGGAAALEALLKAPIPPETVAKTPDDRVLSIMAECIFQAGFNWTVIRNKWPDFERAFDGFDPVRIAFYHDEDMDRLLSDKSIVRNGAKIAAVMDNARFVLDLARDHGSAAACFAAWSSEDYVGLLDFLSKKGTRLGGNTGQRVLRQIGVPSFMLSQFVVARLTAEGIVDKHPTSKRDLRKVQDTFNTWSQESGRDLTQISQILAYSV